MAVVETPLETSIPHKASLAVGRDPTPEERRRKAEKEMKEKTREKK